MVPFVAGEAERPRQRAEHLAGGARAAGLFEPRVVVDGHTRERRHLLATQTRRTASGTGREAHVGGLQPGAAAAQEVGELGSVHLSTLAEAARLIQGLPVPG